MTKNLEMGAIRIMFKQEFTRGNVYPFRGKFYTSENFLDMSMKECDVAMLVRLSLKSAAACSAINAVVRALATRMLRTQR
jgi:hypothetical protein